MVKANKHNYHILQEPSNCQNHPLNKGKKNYSIYKSRENKVIKTKQKRKMWFKLTIKIIKIKQNLSFPEVPGGVSLGTVVHCFKLSTKTVFILGFGLCIYVHKKMICWSMIG